MATNWRTLRISPAFFLGVLLVVIESKGKNLNVIANQ